MSSGSYFPPPVKVVEIPKASGGIRRPGVPTVSDRIAQTVVKLLIEPKLDALFHPDSYGYRPGRSAKQAIAITRERCWRYDWVVECDIKAAFDHIDHELLMKAARMHYRIIGIPGKRTVWAASLHPSVKGVMHEQIHQHGTDHAALRGATFALNANAICCLERSNQPSLDVQQYPVLFDMGCRSQRQAEHVMRSIASRLAVCGLTMHPEKSKIVYCKDSNRRAEYPHVSLPSLVSLLDPGRQSASRTSFSPASCREPVRKR